MAQQQKHRLLLGAHMSISGGLDQAIIQADQIGCTTVQFFSKSNRQWYAKPLTNTDITQFKKAVASSSIQATIIHASYLINIGSPDGQISKRATAALQDELMRAEQLAVDYLVFHPGSHKQEGEAACLNRIAHNINLILSQVEADTTKLLLETMAGQGSSVGHTFEQLAFIFQAIEQKDRVGICLDTCHIFAAGYNISSRSGYERVLKSFDAIIGLDKLYTLHINDSKKAFGSRVDRHEHIGKGTLGSEPFRYIFNDKRLAHIPKILETPKDSIKDDVQNLRRIKRLIEKHDWLYEIGE